MRTYRLGYSVSLAPPSSAGGVHLPSTQRQPAPPFFLHCLLVLHGCPLQTFLGRQYPTRTLQAHRDGQSMSSLHGVLWQLSGDSAAAAEVRTGAT